MITGWPPLAPAANEAVALPKTLRVPIKRGERRTEAQLREHYLVERELADRLRHAGRNERRALYPLVYDELFRRVPHHPMNRPKLNARAPGVERDVAFLRPFLEPNDVFLEIGAGDCALA